MQELSGDNKECNELKVENSGEDHVSANHEGHAVYFGYGKFMFYW